MYFEARGESFLGKVLVAKTTTNRAISSLYPKNICEVVYQPNQFSWTAIPQYKPSQKELQESTKAVLVSVSHKSDALFFHAISVKPEWAKHKQFLVREGNHIFYK